MPVTIPAIRFITRPSLLSGHVQAKLIVARDGEEHVCGVFSLLRSEWLAFAAICHEHNIEISDE